VAGFGADRLLTRGSDSLLAGGADLCLARTHGLSARKPGEAAARFARKSRRGCGFRGASSRYRMWVAGVIPDCGFWAECRPKNPRRTTASCARLRTQCHHDPVQRRSNCSRASLSANTTAALSE
jgi:hypothetical protein